MPALTTPLVSGQQSWDVVVNQNFAALEASCGRRDASFDVMAPGGPTELVSISYDALELVLGDRIVVETVWEIGAGVHAIEVKLNTTLIYSTIADLYGRTKATFVLKDDGTPPGDAFVILESSDTVQVLAAGNELLSSWNPLLANVISIEATVPGGGALNLRSDITLLH